MDTVGALRPADHLELDAAQVCVHRALGRGADDRGVCEHEVRVGGPSNATYT